MVQAQLRYSMQQNVQQGVQKNPTATRDGESYKLSPSSVTLQDLQATGTPTPLRYRDGCRARRQKRRNVMFEKLRSDKRLIEQDDSLVEQALTPLEAVLLTYSLIDQMVRDNVFVPWHRLSTSMLIDDLQQLLVILQCWKAQGTGDALVAASRTTTRDLPLTLELQRVKRAIEVLERERGDMRTALHIAVAAAWKHHELTPDGTHSNSMPSFTPSSTNYVELSRLKPMTDSHTLASAPPHHWMVATRAGGSDEWPSFYKQQMRNSISSNMSMSSYATSCSSLGSSMSSVASLASVASACSSVESLSMFSIGSPFVTPMTSTAPTFAFSLATYVQPQTSVYPTVYGF